VLVLTDGVPGHDRSSEGVLAALARLGPTRARWLGIAEVRPTSRRIARLCARVLRPDRFLAERVRIAPERVAERFGPALADWPERADFVLSTGPSTAAANIAAARRLSARNIYCGFAKWPVTGFSLILSPVPSRARRVALAPRPSTVDAEALPPPRPLAGPGTRTIALLFGGETKHYAYTAEDMDALATRLGTILAERTDWSLLAFDSRRTRADLFDRLARALSALGPRAAIHRFADGGLGSNAAAFEADAILVSADSLSMIHEAVAAGRPTVVLSASAYRPPRRDRAEIDALARSGNVGQETLDGLTTATLAGAPLPPRASEPARLTRLLARHGF